MQLNFLTVVRRSFVYYWRSNVAVVLGVAVAVAVLVGSLLVGDSIRGSLHDLALERLGRTDHALLTTTFFREELASDLLANTSYSQAFDLAVPAIAVNGSLKHTSSGVIVPGVNVLAVRDDFWQLGNLKPPAKLEGRHVILNQDLADALHATVGDALLLTVGRRGAAPTDTVFGRRSREDTVSTMRVIVDAVIPSRGIGGFSLRSDNPRPRNLFMALSWLGEQLGREGRANALFAASTAGRGEVPAIDAALQMALASEARLADHGLRLIPNTSQGYVSLASDELVLPESAVNVAKRTAREMGLASELTSVYLANSLKLSKARASEKGIPYSVVAGLDPTAGAPFGPLVMTDGSDAPVLKPDEMLLNTWAAEDLGAAVGDEIEMTYYVARERGELREETRTFKMKGIVAMTGAASDPQLVPEFEGITDARTMGEWDPPFPIDLKQIRPRDEQYWKDYRTAPKAFVSLAAARSFWLSEESSPAAMAAASPGGDWVTSVRIALKGGEAPDQTAQGFADQLRRHLSPGEFGMTFLPVKEQALRAAEGTTDFGVLFLAMSMFLVAAAAGLVGLLLRLTVERRASQYGILLATGFRSGASARMVMGEGLLLALLGVIIGAPVGAGYAWLIITALKTRWAGAVGGEFPLSLHVSGLSLMVGSLIGLLVAAAAIWWSVRVLKRTSALMLLAGWRAMAAEPSPAARKRAVTVAIVSLSIAAVLVFLSLGAKVISTAGAFFGVGSGVLVGALALVSAQLQGRGRQAGRERLSLERLAWRGASRHWLRSLLTVGLLACASFLIVTVAANRSDLSRLDTSKRDSGAGGFNLMATSDVPIYADLNSAEGRRKLGIAPEASHLLAGTPIMSFRMSAGDDISCLNIQKPTTPRVLGVPPELIERGGFDFRKVLPSASGRANPWQLLAESALSTGEAMPSTAGGSAEVIPAFADAVTAEWNLHLGLGDEIEVPGRYGRKVRLRLVGLLAHSIFQSELLISESQFKRHFGEEFGYGYFLIDTDQEEPERVARALRTNLGDLGFDVRRTADVLASFAEVQNTYLGTFQTLGGLGLLLGTFGIVTVLLRAVVERRSELAMMLALGFRRARLVRMILLENGLLLLSGMLIGTVAALVGVAPHLLLESELADVRWMSLVGTLAACLAVGFGSCAIAAGAAVRGELLSALRSE